MLIWASLGGFIAAYAGKNETKNVQVGETFTVYTTSYYYTQAVLWSYDYSVVEPQHKIYGTTTSVTFKALKAVNPYSVIQATIYYQQSGTTSSGVNKDVDVFRIVIKDNTTVSLNTTGETLEPGDNLTLTAYASGSYSGKYSWTTSNAGVASVSGSDQSVRVHANKAGSAKVTVTIDNGKSASCYITVRQISPTDVSLPGSVTVKEGKSTTLSATLYPSGASTTYTWWSDDTDIASVSSSSDNTVTVYGNGAGQTKIHVRTANGYEDYTNVTVQSTAPTGISIPDNIRLKYGATLQLTSKLYPSYAESGITWRSNNEHVATVNSNGVVSGVGEGTAVITATTVKGNHQAKCDVSVSAKPTHFIICFLDGERIAYALENQPKVVPGEGKITVIDGAVTMEYPAENVHKYVLGVGTDYESGTKVDHVVADNAGLVRQSGGVLQFSGYEPGTKLSIYNIGGVLVGMFETDSNGGLEISLSQYPQNVYIVKIKNQTLKFIKK